MEIQEKFDSMKKHMKVATLMIFVLYGSLCPEHWKIQISLCEKDTGRTMTKFTTFREFWRGKLFTALIFFKRKVYAHFHK